MKTQIITADDAAGMARAAQLLREGELVAFATETVYGLGADAMNAEAVKQIFAAKGRPADNPLISHIVEEDQLKDLVGSVPPMAKKLMDAFWPGPMTLIFPKGDRVPDATTAGLSTVAVRMPSHPAAQELLRLCHIPVAAPSANLSGKPSPTTARDVLADMDGRIPMIVDGGPCGVGVESTVVDCTGQRAKILRPGGVTLEMLEDVLGKGNVDVHQAVLHPLESNAQAASPGMKYKHYAPKAQVRVIEGAHAAARICELYDEAVKQNRHVVIFSVEEERPAFGNRDFYAWGSAAQPGSVAQHLFSALREADRMGMDLVLCHSVETSGVGLAVMNRLLRAAGFDVEHAL